MNEQEKAVIQEALAILDRHMKEPGVALTAPGLVRAYLRLKLERREAEVFAVIFMDNQHRVIEFVEMFQGTIDSASVYPREVVKKALQLNAAACILTHNHPSGISEPSQADIMLTRRLKESLALVDIRVLDHLVVGKAEITSLAERGLI